MRIPTGKRLPLWASVILNMLIAVTVIALVQSFLVKVYRVPSGSMEQTLQGSEAGGDRILVNRLAYSVTSPRQGDIVVFTRPDSWKPEASVPGSGGLPALARSFGDLTGMGVSNEQYLVKRIIAVGGQTVSCCGTDGKLTVDGDPLDEPYIYDDFPFEAGILDCGSDLRSARCFPEFVVPEGQLVLLGDHRSGSSDSMAACRIQSGDTPSGCVRTAERSAVVGQVAVKIWPLNRIGAVG